MPGSSVKEVYLAKSVKDLQKIATIPHTKPNQLVKSAQTIFVKAGEEQENGDEEKAYVLYTKYFENLCKIYIVVKGKLFIFSKEA